MNLIKIQLIEINNINYCCQRLYFKYLREAPSASSSFVACSSFFSEAVVLINTSLVSTKFFKGRFLRLRNRFKI